MAAAAANILASSNSDVVMAWRGGALRGGQMMIMMTDRIDDGLMIRMMMTNENENYSIHSGFIHKIRIQDSSVYSKWFIQDR